MAAVLTARNPALVKESDKVQSHLLQAKKIKGGIWFMHIHMSPIGVFHTNEKNIPRHWSISEVEGQIEIDPVYMEGLKDIEAGQEIVVLFYFHQSPLFEHKYLVQSPPHKSKPMGVFSICSPVRPNPIGLSVLSVLSVSCNMLMVKHADMIDGTPILDIKPHISK